MHPDYIQLSFILGGGFNLFCFYLYLGKILNVTNIFWWVEIWNLKPPTITTYLLTFAYVDLPKTSRPVLTYNGRPGHLDSTVATRSSIPETSRTFKFPCRQIRTMCHWVAPGEVEGFAVWSFHLWYASSSHMDISLLLCFLLLVFEKVKL